MLFTLETSTSKMVDTIDACLSLKWVMVQEDLTRVLVSDLDYEIEDPLWEEAEREESCGFHFCFLSLFGWKMDFIKKILQEISRESDDQRGHYHSSHKIQHSVTYKGKPNQSKEPLHENKEDMLVSTPCFARLSRTSLSHIRASTNGHL